ncbi:MAG: patatin-like phospholipase family protein [Saprospiraceae bacterium]|nr:patatin-like phospholipase family protein [Saprospiraceae bacterium]MCB9324513.1 patatin-like phospholipase family protein [Lewinellaceae bacterium]
MSDQKIYSIGLTMAGAVSAGAYTAGVLDYLLEVLDNWEKAKINGEKDVPGDYKVQIEVMSGASAGSIAAGLTTFSLMEMANPKNKGNDDCRNFMLYDTWVNQIDDGEANNTIEKLLDVSDISRGQPVNSLFNSRVIDQIAQKSVDKTPSGTAFPGYVGKDMDVIMTVTNLNGLDFHVDFESYQGTIPSRMTMHNGFFRFRFDTKDEEANASYLNLDLSKRIHRQAFANSAKASSAFPLGFKARRMTLNSKFVKQYANSVFPEKFRSNIKVDDSVNQARTYDFVAVDGGMVNNEPFGFAYRNIKEKLAQRPPDSQNDFAILMIDPFPSPPVKRSEQDNRTDLLSIIPKLIATLQNQVLFRQEDLLDALSDISTSRFLIDPVRWQNGKIARHPIACGALGGMAGFFDKAFRQHDFELGRKNAQEFLHYNFAEREDINHFIHDGWTEEMKNRFRFFKKDKKGNRIAFLPILPDVNLLNAEQKIFKVPPKPLPEFPRFDPDRFNTITPLIKKRLKKIIEILVHNRLKKGFGNGVIFRTIFFVFRFIGPQILAGRVTRIIEDEIRKEFVAYGLLGE